MKTAFKWIAYSLLGLIVTAVAVILMVANSTRAVAWVADRYAPQYGFAYGEISGGLLGGLEVEDLTFRNETLLDHFRVGWNPAALLHEKVSITDLEATGLDVETIQKVVDAFSSDEPEEDNSTFVLPVTVGIGRVHLAVSPFEESGVSIRQATLNGKNIVYRSDGIDVGQAELSIDTNITQIELHAESKDDIIHVKNISILDIDSIALESVVKRIIETNAHKKVTERADIEIEHHKRNEDNLLPQKVLIDSVVVVVEPSERPEVKINRAELHGSTITIAVHDIVAQKPDSIQMEGLALNIDTNLTQLDVEAELKNDAITVDLLSIRNIDTVALTKIFASSEYNKTKTPESATDRGVAAADKGGIDNPLIPKFLIVKHLDSSIKEATYAPVLVKSAEVNASDVRFNIGTLVAESGTLDIDAVSSFATVAQHAVIKDNHIESHGAVIPLQGLFETYHIPLRKDALDPVALDIDADMEKAKVDLVLSGERLLDAQEGAFNVERVHLANHLVYTISDSGLTVSSEGNISTPYAKNIRLHNLLTFKEGALDYQGRVVPGVLEGIDANYTKPLKDLKISYEGTISSATALIDSEGLKGKFISSDFKKGDFRLSTKAPVKLKEMLSLPEPLQPATVSAVVHVPLDFVQMTPIKAEANITSNIANMNADVLYDKELKVLSKTVFPKDSLLRGVSPELNLDALSPLQTLVTMDKSRLNVDLKSNGLNSKVTYGLEDKNLGGDLVLGGAKFRFSGNTEKEIRLENSVASLQDLIKKINTIYTFEAPPLDGDLKVSLKLKKMKELELLLHANTLTYKAGRKTEYVLDDTMISLGFADSVLRLNQYHTTFQKQKIFATKPSVVSLKKGIVEIAPFWINDALKVSGNYDIDQKKGEILAYADPLDVSHQLIDLSSKIDIQSRLDGNRTSINGTVTILGGNVHYDMDQKSFPTDSDIIIVQDMKKKEASPFMDNLSAMIKVNTQKPLLYKTADADIKAKADLMIQKTEKGPLYTLGTAEILEGSVYAFQDKRFVFKKSLIAFTGDASAPILDITAVYDAIKYEITIKVTGSPATPNIIFSSVPRLSRAEILSVLLFGSIDGAGNNSGDDMMKMMGGAMAKSALANAGIKIDYLTMGADGKVDIGKRLTDKVMIIYMGGDVSGARLQYDYNKYIKGILTTDEDSSGAGIIYRRDFK